MFRVSRLGRRLPEVVTFVRLRSGVSRRWLHEVVIVALMLFLLLVELGLRLWINAQPAILLVVWGVLASLITLWVYINRDALAVWEQQDAEERDHRC